MDAREFANDGQETIRMAMDRREATIWTAMPAVILSFNPAAMTCEVQPAIQARLTQPSTTSKFINKQKGATLETSLLDFPKLVDCPVVFPQGGGALLTFPLKAGDECLVVFAARGIDWWWQNGAWQDGKPRPQPPATCRMHDLSDGFVLPGPYSQPRVPGGGPSKTNAGRPLSPDVVELRSLDGSQSLSFHPVSGAVNITGSLNVAENILAGTGASGSFTTPTGQTVTVQNGIITNLS
jgi:protein gp138